jgi:hypothetical protein
VTRESPRAVLIAWAKSEGFAAVHNGVATDEQIVDDLLAYLDKRGFDVVERNKTFDWNALQALRKASP